MENLLYPVHWCRRAHNMNKMDSVPALQTRAHLTFSTKRQTGNILDSASDRATLSQLLNFALVVEKQPETIQLKLQKKMDLNGGHSLPAPA